MQSISELNEGNHYRLTTETEFTYLPYFKHTRWDHIHCGDIVLLQDGEKFPADCIILSSSSANGECFV